MGQSEIKRNEKSRHWEGAPSLTVLGTINLLPFSQVPHSNHPLGDGITSLLFFLRPIICTCCLGYWKMFIGLVQRKHVELPRIVHRNSEISRFIKVWSRSPGRKSLLSYSISCRLNEPSGNFKFCVDILALPPLIYVR